MPAAHQHHGIVAAQRDRVRSASGSRFSLSCASCQSALDTITSPGLAALAAVATAERIPPSVRACDRSIPGPPPSLWKCPSARPGRDEAPLRSTTLVLAPIWGRIAALVAGSDEAVAFHREGLHDRGAGHRR